MKFTVAFCCYILLLAWSAEIYSSSNTAAAAFVPVVLQQQQQNNHRFRRWGSRATPRFSTVEIASRVDRDVSVEISSFLEEETHFNGLPDGEERVVAAVVLNGNEIKERLLRQLAKLREKDSTSPKLSKEVRERERERDEENFVLIFNLGSSEGGSAPFCYQRHERVC